MAELYKLVKRLRNFALIVLLISIVIIIGIIYATKFYAEEQQLNQNCDNSTYILSNYSADLTKNITNSTYPLIWKGK